MSTVATIEARMNSSRLPGKVMLESMGIPMLGHLINRLKKVKSIDKIVLATTCNPSDDILCDFASRNEILFFRGDELNVMKRVLDAGKFFHAKTIVEITGDCPILDPLIVEQVIKSFNINNVDFVNNNSFQSYPDGMDTRVFSINALEKSYSLTNNKLDYEHVTLHMKNNPQIFKIINLIAPDDLFWPELGLTLDEIDDYKLIDKIICNLYLEDPFFSCRKVLKFLKKNMNLIELNKKVLRKGDT
tara:strand:- start:713 stop:1447 length:735 start_codon:yes stop_codon:yes gene_type:complete